jgi:putative transposase
LNRGNGRSRLFHKPGDYQAFLDIMARVQQAVPVRVLGFCLMPNHWHLLLCPQEDGDLSKFMLRLTTTHVRRSFAYRRHDAGGHLYQGRFKSFPVQDDFHLLTVLRYIEANPLRAKLCQQIRSWKWSSLSLRQGRGASQELALGPLPLPLPDDWEQIVQSRWPKDELETVRQSVVRGRPFGATQWVAATAKRLGLDFTLRERGRPRKYVEAGAKEKK